MFHVISDIHGNLSSLEKSLSKCPTQCEQIFLLGDIGFGFEEFDVKGYYELITFYNRKGKMITAIQGNHDNAEAMSSVEVTTLDGPEVYVYNGKFFLLIPGALSYDKKLRVEGVSWWRNEEMNHAHCNETFDLIVNYNFDYILSHDAPLSKYLDFFSQTLPSATNTMLNGILTKLSEKNKKSTWIHGHLHQSYFEQVNNVNLIGVAEDTYITIF
ncbi:MAG TPA: metallophosphoesterase family protein [Taishania sp.]|nr:metallophosphoesterase family protein [Taishania sp.]